MPGQNSRESAGTAALPLLEAGESRVVPQGNGRSQGRRAVLQDLQLQLPGVLPLLLVDVEARLARAPGLEAQQYVGGVVDAAGFLEGLD